MNTDLMNITSAMTMSSLEIAELTGKLHKNVIRDIRNMLKELGNLVAQFSATRFDDRGKAYEYFNLPKRETTILVSGYSVVMRAKIVDRWMELEAAALNGFSMVSNEKLLEYKYNEFYISQTTIDDKSLDINGYSKFVSKFAGFHIKVNHTYAALRELKFLMSGRGNMEWNYPYAKWLLEPYCYFEFKRNDRGIVTSTLVTARGQRYILQPLLGYFKPPIVVVDDDLFE